MYNDSGKTLKVLTYILFILEILASIIVAIVLATEELYGYGALVFFGGVFIAFVTSVILSAIAEAAEAAKACWDILSSSNSESRSYTGYVPKKQYATMEEAKAAYEKNTAKFTADTKSDNQ